MQNEIIAEIRRGRDEHARRVNYDIDKMFDELMERTERLRAEGWTVVDLSRAHETSSEYQLHDKPAPKRGQ